ATLEAMRQVSGPVIAVGLVLSAVFVPCAFISGITGQFFRQFALTIAVSTVISAFNSLTLSPALTALLLRPRAQASESGEPIPPLPRLAFPLVGCWLGWELLAPWLEARLPGLSPTEAALIASLSAVALGWIVSRPLNHILGAVFRGFNAAFAAATNGYTRLV